MTAEEAFLTIKMGEDAPDAWEVLISNLYPTLLAYVASLLLTFRISPGETASDIVHEVLTSWYERQAAEKLRGVESLPLLSAYLRVSCRNLLIDRYRHERSAAQMRNFLTLKFGSAFQDEGELYKTLFLKEIIKKMPEKCAELFKIYVTEDLSPAEIADRLGEPPAKFYSRWYRCISHAKEIFFQMKKKSV